MPALNYNENWNGVLCNDAFPFIRPISQYLYLHAEVEVMINDYFLGYAKITAIKQMPFGEISDLQSYCIIGKNAGYLKSILRKMNGNVLDSTPFCFGTAEYIQRNKSTQAEAIERRWMAIAEKSQLYTAADPALAEPNFTTKSHWNGEEAYTH